MRLIDAESLIQNAEPLLTFQMLAKINEEKTADAVPVVHGKWMSCGWDVCEGKIKVSGVKCSICGNRRARQHNYCEECGAKMDGE